MGVGAVYHCSTTIKSSFLTFRKHFQTYTLFCTVHIKKNWFPSSFAILISYLTHHLALNMTCKVPGSSLQHQNQKSQPTKSHIPYQLNFPYEKAEIRKFSNC